MALNKRKVLDAARKHAQKGAKAKALKEYDKLLKADPRDAKLLLEVGDAYRRWGQAEDAIGQYAKVAAQYRQDGFDARAVAVFKQILNLDPKHYEAYVSLGELYQRMGLDSEAVAALQMAADGYHKEGRKPQALELLRQMAALDPTNTTSRLKVAELLRAEGLNDDALGEYRAVAEELESQQEREQLISVHERILELIPGDLETISSLVRNLMATGNLEKAEVLASSALDACADVKQYELVIDLYAQKGDDARLAEATRGLAKLYRERGDEDKARDLLQRLPAEDVIAPEARIAVDISEAAEPDLGEDELLDEPFLTLDDEDDASFGDESLDDEIDLEEISTGTPPAETQAPESAAAEEPLPEGDPDQLFAEASVYLRYGKRTQAIASLRSVIAQEPTNHLALEKLGEAYAEDGQNSEAVRTWMRAAEQVRIQGDAAGLEALRTRIEELDPALAAQIGEIDLDGDSAPSIGIKEPARVELDLDLEIDLDLDEAIDEVEDSETDAGLSAPESSSETTEASDADSDGFEIDLDEDSIVFENPPTVDSPDLSVESEATPDVAGDTSGAVEIDFDGDDSIEFEIDPADLSSDDLDTDEEPTAPAALSEAKIAEELEEAEFYIAQDMFEEAEEILGRILEAVPTHAATLVLMGEVRTSSNQVAGAAEPLSPPTGETTQSDLEVEADEEGADASQADSDAEILVPDVSETEADFEVEVDLGLDDEDDAESAEELLAAAAESVEADPESGLEDESDDSAIGFEVDIDLDGDVETPIAAAVESTPEPKPVVEPIASPEPAPVAEVEPLSDAIEEQAAAASAETTTPSALEAEVEPPPEKSSSDPSDSADDEATFDLREALADVLEDDSNETTDSSNTSGVLSTVEDGFESIFSDFKKGVSATLEAGDFDTRYDLGIAYREMGLFDDAIAEFRVCLESPDRRFDSLYLMGLCARDLTRWDDAVNHLEQALALPEIPEERLAGVYFDLSVSQQGAGDLERARSSIERVLELEPNFPGAVDRLASLETGDASMPELAAPGEAYETFDDLFDESDDERGDEAVAAAVPAETFESFDDVVAEAEDVLEEAELVEESGATSDPGDSKRGGRRKNSFV